MRRLKVGLLFGGKSGEHEISIASAASIMRAADRAKYQVVPIAITKAGNWVLNGSPLETMSRPREAKRQAPTSFRDHLNALKKLDVVFPVLHGTYGEDGTVQGLLELADVPYVGAGVAASALGMDKALMKTVLRQHGLPEVDFQVVLRHEWEKEREGTLARLEAAFGYPCFIKPANSGSSVGISKAHSRTELTLALEEAASYDRKMLVERAVEAREIECSVLGNEEPQASVLGEVIPGREFYDYQAKYGNEGTQLLVPAELPQKKAQEIQGLALRAFQALDCSGMARVDFFLELGTAKVYINELNTIPGFTSISMYPKLWEASGLRYPELIDRLIELALERHTEKRRNRTSYDGQLPNV